MDPIEALELFEVIDIHCHLIPLVDDGPQSWDESIQMVRIAAQDGIKRAFATPHWIQGSSWMPSANLVRKSVERLNELLAENGIDFEVYPGMEIGLCYNLWELVAEGVVIPLGSTNYILVETPFLSLPLGMDEVILKIKSLGFTPVLAHPERNMDLQKDPTSILPLVEAGAMTQINAMSLCGGFGQPARRCVEELVRLGVVHAIASDGHSARGRLPVMSEGIRALGLLVGDVKLRRILEEQERNFAPPRCRNLQ